MPTRIWLTVAFVMAFGAPPARAAADGLAAKRLHVLEWSAAAVLRNSSWRASSATTPDGLRTLERREDSRLF